MVDKILNEIRYKNIQKIKADRLMAQSQQLGWQRNGKGQFKRLAFHHGGVILKDECSSSLQHSCWINNWHSSIITKIGSTFINSCSFVLERPLEWVLIAPNNSQSPTKRLFWLKIPYWFKIVTVDFTDILNKKKRIANAVLNETFISFQKIGRRILEFKWPMTSLLMDDKFVLSENGEGNL